MRRAGSGRLSLEITLIVLLLLYFELLGLMRDLTTSLIYDWPPTLAPLVWINISIPFIYVFLRNLITSNSTTNVGRFARLFSPNFSNLRTLAQNATFRKLWIVLSVLYFAAYGYLQGMIVVDISGGLEPRFLIVESSVGYGPVLVWSPACFFGVVLRPYILSAALALSLVGGFLMAAFISLLVLKQKIAAALPGPLAGLAVLCPTCLTSPAMGLILAYIAPTVVVLGIGTAFFNFILTLSTILLVATLLIQWVALSIISRTPLYSSAVA
ncbi:MAG: hypothetical protein NXY59_04635 [Aigarchaeota archaeon]|nr:hypothetical protein [Candidatus Pelearchaeum maunauluense]